MCDNPGLLQLKMVKQKQFLQKPICIILYFTANWIPVIEKKRERILKKSQNVCYDQIS